MNRTNLRKYWYGIAVLNAAIGVLSALLGNWGYLALNVTCTTVSLIAAHRLKP